jgi:hypothetical protein
MKTNEEFIKEAVEKEKEDLEFIDAIARKYWDNDKKLDKEDIEILKTVEKVRPGFLAEEFPILSKFVKK